jgi:hypothetical protein
LTVGSGANRALAVVVFLDGNVGSGTLSVKSVTYAGVSLNRIYYHSPSFYMGTRVELWSLPAGTQPTSGTNNVVVNWTDSGLVTPQNVHSGAFSATGVDQKVPFSSFFATDGASNVTTSANVSLPYSGANDLPFSMVCNGSGVTSSSQTTQWTNNISNGATCDNDGGATATAGTTTFTWAISDDLWVAFAAAFKATASTKLQTKGGKLVVKPRAGTATPATKFSWIQSAEGSTSAAGSTIPTGAFTSSNTAGNAIICGIIYDSSAKTVSSVTDSNGNTYTKAVTLASASNGASADIWYKSNIAGGTNNVVTATYSGSFTSYKQISCHEYSGILLTSPLDKTATAAHSTDPNIIVGPVTPSATRELVFYVNWDIGSSYCADTYRSTFGGNFVCDRVQNGGSVVVTGDGGGGWVTALATFYLSNAPAQTK